MLGHVSDATSVDEATLASEAAKCAMCLLASAFIRLQPIPFSELGRPIVLLSHPGGLFLPFEHYTNDQNTRELSSKLMVKTRRG
jgi:hypothetical protein